MNDADLKKEHERFAVGDRVRHYGTKQWGLVVEIKPTWYGVELLVERIVESNSDFTGQGYWEGTRIDLHERAGVRG